MSSRLLILHDSPHYGGHENMLMKLLPGVLEDGRFEATFCLSQANRRLSERLGAEFPALRTVESPFAKRRGEPYLGRFRWRYRESVRRLVKAERPDLVLLVQGRIENLAAPMTALPAMQRLVSYLPMAHLLRDMQRGGLIGDRIRRPLYRRPNRFIVPSEAVADQVRSAGAKAPISVVENVVDPPLRTPKSYARVILDLPAERKVGLFLGRLDPVQKGIDRLIRALERSPPGALRDWTFLFVGDGSGAPLVEQAAQAAGLDLRVLPWTDRPDHYLSAADVLLLPSRWEGLPLVMLEALHYGLPTLASDIDVHRCYLPERSCIDFDTVDLPAALALATSSHSIERFTRHSEARMAANTLDAARERFVGALAEGLAA